MKSEAASLYPILNEKKIEPINGGFYLKAKCIQDSAIASAPPHVREIWDWLLKQANHKDNKTNGKIIRRGQVFTDYKEIQEGLAWKDGFVKKMYTKNHVDYSMRWLRKEGMVTTDKTTRGLIVTICKYERYQNISNYSNHNGYDTGLRVGNGSEMAAKMGYDMAKPENPLPARVSEHGYDMGYDTVTTPLRQPADTIQKEVKEKNSSSTPPKQVWRFSHKGFFDRQIASNAGEPELGKYQKLVEHLHELDDDGNYRFANVLSLAKQISFKDYKKLKDTEGNYNLRSLKEVLDSMENKKDLKKEYTNVFLTANAWLKNEFKK